MLARVMREAAKATGVPIVRKPPLARGEVGTPVPPDLFDIMAELILWAREVRDGASRPRRPVPGEGLPRAAVGGAAPAVSPTPWPPQQPT